MWSSPFIRPAQKDSLMNQAYRAIKESISSNAVKPGDLLSENQIAKELGMSRTPVREALRMLESEDYIEVRNGIGIFVKSISLEDIRDIFQVRKALELIAAETAIYNITQQDVLALEHCFHQLLDDHNNQRPVDLKEFIDIDYQLHELLVARCSNKYVSSIMQGIHGNSKRFLGLSFESLNSLAESTEQHLHLLALIRQRDQEGLQEALAQHMDWSVSCIFKNR